MLYKVWAQNCVRPKGRRILEATQDDLNKVFDEIYNQALESNLIDDSLDGNEDEIDDRKVAMYYGMIQECWDNYKEISAGDYEIVDVKSRDEIRIPNVCCSDASIIFL